MQLPGWNCPVVANLQTGQAQYDNYNGHWGEQKELHTFLQAYAVEKPRHRKRAQRHRRLLRKWSDSIHTR